MTDFVHVVCPHCDTTNRLARDRLGDHPDCGKCGKPIFTSHAVEMDREKFQHHITRNDIPVLVDFWAPWCGPCRSMADAYEQAARELEPEIRVAKLNTEDVQDIANRYVIRGIPTLALFRRGRELARQSGAMDAAHIVSWARAKATR